MNTPIFVLLTLILQVRDLWKAVDIFYEKRSEERDIVMSVVEGTMEKYKIDSNELDVKIPDLLLRECEKEIHRVRILFAFALLSLQSQYWFIGTRCKLCDEIFLLLGCLRIQKTQR